MRQRTPDGIMDVVANPLEKNADWLSEEEAPVSSEAEENKAIARRFLEETMAKGNLDVIDELAAPDFVDRSLMPGQGPTREDFKRSVAEALDTTPITSFTIEEQIAEGDKVVTKYRHSSVQRREVMGIPPTEEEKTVSGIYIHRISGGKITEEWGIIDAVLAMESLAQEIRERERIEQDLRVARTIQQASLPKEVPQLEGWQIAPFYRPAREVGGDFYDFHFLFEGRLGLVTGDATGKGVPAALVMSTTCGMLQLAAQVLDSSSPGEVLERVNETLVARIPLNMFVTCFYGVLEPKSATLRYANAGHDPPYLWHGGGAEELRARGMPLGLMPGMSYEEGEVSLREGESVLFYSDGLVEAHDPKGEMFGFPRLRARVAEHGEERSLADFLLEELYSFVGESWEQEDDITLLTLKRSASRS
jgi:serine phosphatase RsbU (regulator of sigma subunit)/predicted ester cyclase